LLSRHDIRLQHEIALLQAEIARKDALLARYDTFQTQVSTVIYRNLSTVIYLS